MDLAGACPICGRAIGESGYLVVERTYWYHDCAGGLHTPADHAAVVADTLHGAPGPAPFLMQARQRVLVSPVDNLSTIEQFNAALLASPAVRSAELEQFVGQTAVLTVEATGASDLISALLRLDGFALAGLTVTADGQLSVQLDEAAASRHRAPAPANHSKTDESAPAVPQQSAPDAPAAEADSLPAAEAPELAPPPISDDALQNLRETVSRLSGRLSQVMAEGRPGTGSLIPKPFPSPATSLTDAPAMGSVAAIHTPAVPSSEPAAEATTDHPDATEALPVHYEPTREWATADRGGSWAGRHAEAHEDSDEQLTDAVPATNDAEGLPSDEPSDAPLFIDVTELPAAMQTEDSRDDLASEDRQDQSDPSDREASNGYHPETAVGEPVTDSATEETFTSNQPAYLADPEPVAAIEEPVSHFSHSTVAPQTATRSAAGATIVAEVAEEAGREQRGALGQVQVVAYPFENFAVVNSFINSLRRLPDVGNVAPRRFRGGVIQLAIDYSGSEPLAGLISSLSDFEPRIVSDDGETINVSLGGAQ